MHLQALSPLTYLFLVFFAFHIAASGIESSDADLIARQQQTTVTCQDYATIANLSTIGQNSTFRGAFIQSSPDGTLQSSAILDNATSVFTKLALINNTALNTQCGNLSAIAIAEAPKNFSMGMVGPFLIGAGVQLGSGAGYTAVFTAAMVGLAVSLL